MISFLFTQTAKYMRVKLTGLHNFSITMYNYSRYFSKFWVHQNIVITDMPFAVGTTKTVILSLDD